jgi:NADH-quinone oxidoreductase subunit J
MSPFLFWIFAAQMMVFGAFVLINRNHVASALSLVVSFISLAALFISLDAYFICIIQVLVYAGAIMVLFLFIIMLLDLRAESLRQINWVASAGGLAVTLIFVTQVLIVVNHFKFARQTFPTLTAPTTDDTHHIGLLLFSNYTLPFQIVGVIILVATIGVVILSRREPR